MSLTLEERIEVMLRVGNNTTRQVARLFNERHPDCDPIKHDTVAKLITKFKETGIVIICMETYAPPCTNMVTIVRCSTEDAHIVIVIYVGQHKVMRFENKHEVSEKVSEICSRVVRKAVAITGSEKIIQDHVITCLLV